MSISWPVGAADVQTPVAAATNTVSVNNKKTIVDMGVLAADCELTIEADADELEAGAELIIKAKSDGTARDITLVGALPDTIAGVISKTIVQAFVYDGSSFIATGAAVQLD